MPDIQITFLKLLKKHKMPATIYLKNGIKLKGIIADFTEEALMLGNPIPQLVYKENISTIQKLDGISAQ